MTQTIIGNIVIETNEELEELQREYKAHIENLIKLSIIKTKHDIPSFKSFVENKKEVGN